MNAWGELKRILNKKKVIPIIVLIEKLNQNHMLYNIIYRYLNILERDNYIKIYYKHLANYKLMRMVKLIRKIPEKLTIADAKKIKHMPWLSWFKYPE